MAFNQCTSLISASLKGAFDIGEGIFYRCTSLKNVVLSDKLEMLPKMAFYGCDAIKTVILPPSIKVLSEEAFKYCSSLESITLPQGLEKIGELAFLECPLKTIELPGSLSVVGNGAFSGCSALTNVVFHTGLSEIGDIAFSGCSSLREIKLPSSLTYIGAGAFAKCAFTSFTLPKGVVCEATSMGLSSCPNLTSIEVENDNPKYFVQGDVLFCKNDTLVAYPGGGNPEYTIPSNVKAIAPDAFHACKIQKVILPDGLKSIGGDAFSGTQITSINIPSSVDTIGVRAFSGSLLSEISIQDGIKELADEVFFNTKISSFVIPNTVEKISSGAFELCKELSYIKIGTAVESIAENAFEDCCKLTYVNIPASVNYISPKAFARSGVQKFVTDKANEIYLSYDGVLMSKDRKNLLIFPPARTGEYVVPSIVHDINDYAFKNSLLTRVELSENVGTVGNSAFENSKDLETVVLPSTLYKLGQHAFGGCSALKEIYAKMEEPFAYSYSSSLSNYDTAVLYVPVGTKELYISTKYWSYFKNIVEKDYTAAIDKVDVDTVPVEVARYSVSGQRISTKEKGLVIVKMSDGNVRKIYKLKSVLLSFRHGLSISGAFLFIML